MGLNLNDLEDAKAFREVFVDPMLDAIRAEVRPLVEEVKGQRERIDRLEKNQRRALAGLAATFSALTIALGFGVDWVRKRIGL